MKHIKQVLLNPVINYVLLTAIVSLVLFWRYPNNVVHANFYAEDGSVFLQQIIDKGWMRAIFTPFNGYFVVGMYLLEAVGWVINGVFGREGLLTLSAIFAVSSIVFMASVIALPYLLFRRTFGRVRAMAMVVCGALVPLPLGPHIVLGTIGNQKWTFMYLATLLLMYRLLHWRTISLRRVVAIDSVVLVCAYTNSTTYALVPLLFLPYAVNIWQERHKTSLAQGFKIYLRTWPLRSLLVLTLLLLPQLLYVALDGIPKLPGYLDTPYEVSKTVEIFINRTYLFGVTHQINHFLNDAASILLFIMLLLVLRWLKGNERTVFLVGIYAAGVASLLFVVNRPGVSAFFNGYEYSGSGPDQFFFAQSLIMYVPIVLAIFAYGNLCRVKWIRLSVIGIALGFIVISGLHSNATFGARWRNASVFENSADTFIDQAIMACSIQKRANNIKVSVYPYPDARFALNIDDDAICNARLEQYQPTATDLRLVPNDNDFIKLDGPHISQTFRATQPRLNGIRIFISNFNKPTRHGVYQLRIYDGSCRRLLRVAKIPTRTIDSSSYNARFGEIEDSRGKAYCYSINSPQPPYDPIAVQKSAAHIYESGKLILGDVVQDTDLVFEPLYSQNR